MQGVRQAHRCSLAAWQACLIAPRAHSQLGQAVGHEPHGLDVGQHALQLLLRQGKGGQAARVGEGHSQV